MKVNPKGIVHQYEIPNVMILAQAVNELKFTHPKDANHIDAKFITAVRTNGGFFMMRRKRTIFVNYYEFQTIAEMVLDFLKSEIETYTIIIE